MRITIKELSNRDLKADLDWCFHCCRLPHFSAVSSVNSTLLPAVFVLTLHRPVPLSLSIVRKIQNITSKLTFWHYHLLGIISSLLFIMDSSLWTLLMWIYYHWFPSVTSICLGLRDANPPPNGRNPCFWHQNIDS